MWKDEDEATENTEDEVIDPFQVIKKNNQIKYKSNIIYSNLKLINIKSEINYENSLSFRRNMISDSTNSLKFFQIS